MNSKLLMGVAALSLVASTGALAGSTKIKADVSPTSEDITSTVIAAINESAVTSYVSKDYVVSGTYRTDSKVKLNINDGVPTSSQYKFDFDGDGINDMDLNGSGNGTVMNKDLIGGISYSALDAAADGVISVVGGDTYDKQKVERNDSGLYTQGTSGYQFKLATTTANDPTVATALGSGDFKYYSSKTGGNVALTTSNTTTVAGTQLLDETQKLDYTGYDYTNWNGDSKVLTSSLDLTQYTFTNSQGQEDNLSNYVVSGEVVIPATETTNAATAVSHYTTDKTNYDNTMTVWSNDNGKYQAAVKQYNVERTNFEKLVDAYDNATTGYAATYTKAANDYTAANIRYQAADADFDTAVVAYNTQNSAYEIYEGSVAKAIDDRMGKIHELITTDGTGKVIFNGTTAGASKNVVEGVYKGNLAIGTTVEDHLVALDNTIGLMSTLSGDYVGTAHATNNTVAANLQSLNDGLETEVATRYAEDVRVLREAKEYTDVRFGLLNNKIDQLEDKMEKGLAANAALAGLTPLSSEYKTQLSAAMGGYGSNQAIAIGGYHYINNSTLLNAGAAYGGNSDVSYKVGVTFGF